MFFICCFSCIPTGSYLKSNQQNLSVVLQASQFKPKEIVADIGAAEGWFGVALGIYSDSLVFVLEDIDSSTTNRAKLDKAIKRYSKERGKFTCTYSQVIGSKKTTNLSSSYFDKILLIDTYHHLEFKDEVISDLNRILKNDGKIIVCEVIANKPGEKFKGCNTVIFTQSQILSTFERNGFHLEQIFKTANRIGKKVRVFRFGKNIS